MSVLPRSIRNLIEQLNKLPGVGPKTASRLAFFLLRAKDVDRELLAEAVQKLKTNLVFCQQCHNLAENMLCAVCSDKNRDQKIICVVEEPLDVLALEQGRRFGGVYHVLGGALSPIDGIGPDNLKIQELLDRVKNFSPPARGGDEEGAKGVIEIIIATNPSLEGEGTAMYLAKELKNLSNVKITRIAHGLPIGGDIEYADELTISKALEGRREYKA